MIDSQTTGDICVTTLAIGKKYRQLANLLAQDLLKLSPGTPFVILTDNPDDFSALRNVIPIQHKIKSIGIYHDKLYCLEQSLKNFNCCIFLDADCRLFKNLVLSRIWKNGLTAKSCYGLIKHFQRNKNYLNSLDYKICEKISKEYQINLDEVKFVNECFFAFKNQDNRYTYFLEIWKELRIYFEINKFYNSDGIVIGLASQIAKIDIHHYDTGYPEVPELHQIDDVYKDKLFAKRISFKDDIQERLNIFEKERQKIDNSDRWLKWLNNMQEKQRKAKELKKLQTQFANLIIT